MLCWWKNPFLEICIIYTMIFQSLLSLYYNSTLDGFLSSRYSRPFLQTWQIHICWGHSNKQHIYIQILVLYNSSSKVTRKTLFNTFFFIIFHHKRDRATRGLGSHLPRQSMCILPLVTSVFSVFSFPTKTPSRKLNSPD